jgi:hypothetical protein
MIEHVKINIRERRRSNTMQRNWQHMVRKTKKHTEKLATYGTQDEEKQSKNTTQYALDTTIRKQNQIM